MKHHFPSCFPLTVCILLLGAAVTGTVLAQSPQKQRNEILKELNSTTPGQGRVTVHEDESIKHVLGRPMSPARTVYTSADGTVQFHRLRGFKVRRSPGITSAPRKTRHTENKHRLTRHSLSTRRWFCSTPRFGACAWATLPPARRRRRPCRSSRSGSPLLVGRCISWWMR